MKTHPRMMKRTTLKNGLLLSTFVFSQIHTIFWGSSLRVNWYLFTNSDYSRRIDFAVMYYSIAIDFLILSYCLHYPKGIDRRVSRFILIVTSLDMVHLITNGKQHFGFSKIGIAFIIYMLYAEYKSKKNGSR